MQVLFTFHYICVLVNTKIYFFEHLNRQEAESGKKITKVFQRPDLESLINEEQLSYGI